MSPSKRLQPVQRLESSRERSAARQLGNSQRHLQEQEAKLQELLNYREEYQLRYKTDTKYGMPANKLREYQLFLARLDEAVRQQNAIVKSSQSDRELKRNNWQKRYTRSQALDRVMSRYQAEERKAEEREEQKDDDERSLRGVNRKK